MPTNCAGVSVCTAAEWTDTSQMRGADPGHSNLLRFGEKTNVASRKEMRRIYGISKPVFANNSTSQHTLPPSQKHIGGRIQGRREDELAPIQTGCMAQCGEKGSNRGEERGFRAERSRICRVEALRATPNRNGNTQSRRGREKREKVS